MLSSLITVLVLVGNWLIFQKMGLEGWMCIIPFYNVYKEFEVMYGNGWKMLTLLIPFYNIYVIVKFNIDLAREFGQSSAFGLGLLFIPYVFTLLLGFGSYEFRNGNVDRKEDFLSDIVNDLSNGLNSPRSSADELAKYKKLLDDGAISREEYDRVKDELLNR